MSGIDSGIIQTIKDRADIIDVIGGYIQVKRAGRSFLALCPFHNEKTPSFNINADNQFFHCFGCGANGDVISFIKMYENVDFVDAVKLLADRYGVIIPESGTFSRKRNQKRPECMTYIQMSVNGFAITSSWTKPAMFGTILKTEESRKPI